MVLKQTIEVLISGGCVKISEIPKGKGAGYILGAEFGKSRGEGGSCGKSLPWGWFGYFLEPHIINQIYFKKSWKGDLYLCIFFVCW